MLVLTNQNLKSSRKPYIEVKSHVTDRLKSIRNPIIAINLSKVRLVGEVLIDCFKIVLVDAREYTKIY